MKSVPSEVPSALTGTRCPRGRTLALGSQVLSCCRAWSMGETRSRGAPLPVSILFPSPVPQPTLCTPWTLLLVDSLCPCRGTPIRDHYCSAIEVMGTEEGTSCCMGSLGYCGHRLLECSRNIRKVGQMTFSCLPLVPACSLVSRPVCCRPVTEGSRGSGGLATGRDAYGQPRQLSCWKWYWETEQSHCLDRSLACKAGAGQVGSGPSLGEVLLPPQYGEVSH